MQSSLSQVAQQADISSNALAITPSFIFNIDDIVKVVQYGYLEKLKSFFQTVGNHAVNQLDKEGCSFLHWAALNNRLKIVQYLIENGAIVDVVGGELKATPLHWATRQGFLKMVVLLVKHGADACSKDIQYCNCFHVAAQFGHSNILTFLLANLRISRQNTLEDVSVVNKVIDDKNIYGLTPLMLASKHVCNPDPVRILANFGANLDLKDSIKENTSLHWAIISGNYAAVSALLDFNANTSLTNKKGESAIDIVKEHQQPWFYTAIQDAIKAHPQPNVSLTRVQLLKVYSTKFLTCILPLLFILSFGFVFASSFAYLVKCSILIAICLFLYLCIKYCLDDTYFFVLPFSIYITVKVCMTLSLFLVIFSTIPLSLQISFVASFLLLWYYFLYAWISDPGYIHTNIDKQCEHIINLSNNGKLDIVNFCSTCLMHRPIRSKHCSVCNKCVAKFDHHCPWIGNCLGFGNHRYFVFYLFFLLLSLVFYIVFILLYFQHASTCSRIFFLEKFFLCNPWITWFFSFSCIAVIWVFFLLLQHLYQISQGLTTNERMKGARYAYLTRHTADASNSSHKQSTLKSPFNRGICLNLADFLHVRIPCICSQTILYNINWKNIYEIEDYYLAKTQSQTKKNQESSVFPSLKYKKFAYEVI